MFSSLSSFCDNILVLEGNLVIRVKGTGILCHFSRLNEV